MGSFNNFFEMIKVNILIEIKVINKSVIFVNKDISNSSLITCFEKVTSTFPIKLFSYIIL